MGQESVDERGPRTPSGQVNSGGQAMPLRGSSSSASHQEKLATLDLTVALAYIFTRIDQLVAKPLVIPHVMIMDEIRPGVPACRNAQGFHHPIHVQAG